MPNHHPVRTGRDLSLRIADNPKNYKFYQTSINCKNIYTFEYI